MSEDAKLRRIIEIARILISERPAPRYLPKPWDDACELWVAFAEDSNTVTDLALDKLLEEAQSIQQDGVYE